MLILLTPVASSLTVPPLASPELSTPSRDSELPPSRSTESLRAPELAPSSKRLSQSCLTCPRRSYRKAAVAQKLNDKWNATAIAKKFALRAKRASLTDFDRFKVMISRKNRSFKLRQLAAKINGAGKKAAPAKKAAAPAKKK